MTALIDCAAKQLQASGFVDFAVLFGSFACNRATNISDIDIGIYTERAVGLLEIGLLTTTLEKAFRRKIDIIVLNDLYKKRPALAYEIISKGLLICCKNKERYVEYKKNTYLYYLDTLPMREETNRSFQRRLNSKRFGERNYAGAA